MASPNGAATNGVSGLALPPMVKWAVEFIKAVGPTTAIAVFLVWFVTSGTKDLMKSLVEGLAAHEHTTQMHVMGAEQARQEIRFYMRQFCVHTASTDAERAQCLAGP